MKKQCKRLFAVALCLLLLAPAVAVGQAASAAGETDVTADFIDPVLASRIRRIFGLGPDEPITAEACAQVTSLDITKFTHSDYITNLAGLEHFTELTALYCSGNLIRHVDASFFPKLENLNCGSKELVSVDVSRNPALRMLDCGISSQLEQLDVTNNPLLRQLYCIGGKLTQLDVSKNPKLTRLECRQNQLSELDVTNNHALETLGAASNLLTRLDLRSNPLLYRPSISSNYFPSTAAVPIYGDDSSQASSNYSGQIRYENLRIDYYPQLVPQALQVRFVGNGAESGVPQTYYAQAQTVDSGVEITLPTEIPVRAGYHFKGWRRLHWFLGYNDLYQGGETLRINEDFRLEAEWGNNFFVTYNANGGHSAPETQEKVFAVPLILSTQIPIRKGCEFLGWDVNPTGSSASYYMPGDRFNNNDGAELFAVWRKGVFGTKPQYHQWYHYILFFLCFGFIWMWF